MVDGFLPTLMVGMLGGLLAEVIRIVGALRADKPPGRRELLATMLLTLLGGGAVLFGWDDPQTAYKVAVLGAAFPLTFSAATNSASTEKPRRRDGESQTHARRLVDYVSGRF